MNVRYDKSPLWEVYERTHVTAGAAADLTGFKSGDVNYKLALWSPQQNGVRYLKALIYNMAAGLSEQNWERLRRIRNRYVGDPITVRYNGENVCMDYLLAISELEFISSYLSLADSEVLEIGAGYGRTCHAIMSNCVINSYSIVDLENSLALSAKYLSSVLPEEEFAKIRFIPATEVEKSLQGAEFDLCINVDSFAEMTPDTVSNYLTLIGQTCNYFYVNNPVGKYFDKSLDGHSQGDHLVQLALSTGPLRDIIDIHDSQEVHAQVPKFKTAYKPGPEWECVADSPAVCWSYYWQAVYRRDGRRSPASGQRDAC